MDTSPAALVKTLFPKVPLLLQTAASHTLGLSSTSSKWDLRTELTVKLLRSFIGGPMTSPISKQQHMSLKDPGIKGPLWVSKVAFPVPEEDDVRKALLGAIDAMKEGDETYTLPEIRPVEGEWTGYRAGVDKHRHRADFSEEQHYEKLMAEVISPVTILYFHGGAFYLMDLASHRPICSRLAKQTGGRCFSVRYRLAPQNPFPAALLDALIAYLSLLSPPPGSYHAPVPASNIVFAGDSAGGNLVLSLTQFLLHLHRTTPTNQTPTIRFHNQDVSVPLPAGVACNSAWTDLTRCMPSILQNLIYDYLPAPPSNDKMMHFPRCKLWPTDPPRGDLYCDTTMLCHPLVSPLGATDWKGVPPVWLVYGTECLTDEGKVVARRMARQGGSVSWVQFDAMPHCFSMIFDALQSSKDCFKLWSGFASDVVAGTVPATSGVWVEARTGRKESVDVVGLLAEVGDEDVGLLMREARGMRWTGRDGETILLPKL